MRSSTTRTLRERVSVSLAKIYEVDFVRVALLNIVATLTKLGSRGISSGFPQEKILSSELSVRYKSIDGIGNLVV